MPDPLKCAACGRNVAVELLACQFCGAPAPGKEVDKTAQAVREANALLAREVIRSEMARARTRAGRAFDGVLLILGAIVVVPAILLMVPMVKRWGRIPLGFLIPEMLLAAMLGYATWPNSPVIFPAVLIADVALVVLFVRRSFYGKASDGIFLGYSGATVAGLVIGTVLAFWGLVKVGAWWGFEMPAAHALAAAPESRTASQVLKDLERGPRHVRLTGASLDGAKAAWRVEAGGAGGWSFEDPRTVVVLSPEDLAARRAELVGRYVSIAAIHSIKVEGWQGGKRGRKLDELGTKDRGVVWVRSDEVEAGSSNPLAQVWKDQRAVGVVMRMDPKWVEKTITGVTAADPVAVQGGGTKLGSEQVVRCAPVNGTGGRLWVTWPDLAPVPAGSGEFVGVVERLEGEFLEALKRQAKAKWQAEVAEPVGVLVSGTAESWRKLRRVGPGPERPGLGGFTLGLVAGGVGLLGFVLWRLTVE